jgi:hypothetical protein
MVNLKQLRERIESREAYYAEEPPLKRLPSLMSYEGGVATSSTSREG